MLLTPSRTLRAGILVLLAGGFAVTDVSAQAGVVMPNELAPSVSVALRVDELYRKGEYRESLALLEPHLGSSPSDYLAWVMASRDALALGYADPEPDSARAWLRRSITFGEGALALDAQGVDGQYVTLAAKGRLALISGSRDRARLGAEVERESLALLAIDSLYAGAHNAVGRFYFEVAKLSRIERFFARAWVGGEVVSRATWEAAERHLRRAVELQPERNFHHLDLGMLLYERGRIDEARRVLRETLEVPLETPAQEGFRREARQLLQRIDGREAPDPGEGGARRR